MLKLIKKLLSKRLIFLTLIFLMLLGVVITVYTPQFAFFKWGAGLAIQAMVAYVLIGLVFMSLREEWLMVTSLFCAAILALFLKFNTSSQANQIPEAYGPKLGVGIFELAEGVTIDRVISQLNLLKPEIVGLQKITSSDKIEIAKKLSFQYPFYASLNDSAASMIFLSKVPFLSIDTIIWNKNKALVCCIKSSKINDKLLLYNVLSPSLGKSQDYQEQKVFYNRLAHRARQTKENVLFMGNLNEVPWSAEILELRRLMGLTDCRRDFYPALPNLLERPKDHMFNSQHLNCTEFHEIRDVTGLHLGLYANFQKVNTSQRN